MPTYKYPVYIALATILGFSLAEVEITGVNDLSVPTPSRFDVLRNKAFPSLFSARVDLNFASDTYEISSKSRITKLFVTSLQELIYHVALLLASNDEEGIPFSVSYTSPIDQFGDIGEFIIKAGEDEAVPVSEFEVDDDGWQMSFRPLEYNENVPSLAMKFIAVSPEG